MTPGVIKWAGGKRKLAPRIDALFGTKPPHRYIEPFAGSLAVYLFRYFNESITPNPRVVENRNAIWLSSNRLDERYVPSIVLTDANPALMDFYDRLRIDWRGVIAEIEKLPTTEWKDSYEELRKQFNARHTALADGDTNTRMNARAALFWWLNRACFNGLWRVNKAGAFNVPPGSYTEIARPDPATFEAVSNALSGALLLCADALALLDEFVAAPDACAGAQFYLDPPYSPTWKPIEGRSGAFTSYTAPGFAQAQHEKMIEQSAKLAKRGATVIYSNHDDPLLRERLEASGATIYAASVHRSIGASASTRERAAEVLAVWRPLEGA